MLQPLGANMIQKRKENAEKYVPNIENNAIE